MAKNYVCFGPDGAARCLFYATELPPLNSNDPCAFVPLDDEFEPPSDFLDRAVFKDGQIRTLPARPGAFYTKDVEFLAWVPNPKAAASARQQEVAAELNRRLYLPCNGFDADKVSRDRISGTIARLQRGDGLPAGWMGWRDADNQQHWAEDDAATVLANLCTLSRAIEDREQALLVAGWTHKANIAALEDIDAILSYDMTQGWPT